MSDETLDTLTELLRDVLDDDEIVLTPETTARDVPGWDSLANVRLILAVEARYNTRFAAAEVARLRNVGELADLVAQRR